MKDNVFIETQHSALIKKCRNWFLLLIACQLLFWTLTPAILLDNTYVDILENLIWGKHFQWGYDKDPFLGGFLTFLAYKLTGGQMWSAYLLSQVSIVICFFAVWQLAKRMLTPIQAIVAVSLLIGVLFFSHSSPEFNDDILELPLWALTSLFFYDALQKQKIPLWMCVGIFAALALMAKYYSAILLLAMFLFTICNHRARQSFRKPGIYIALFLLILIVTPNIIWLIKNSFISLHYAFARADVDKGTNTNLLMHITNPFSFLVSMIGVVLPPIVVSLICFRKNSKMNVNSFDLQFLFALCFGPLLLTILFSIITGANLHYTWATPLFNLFGIFLIACLNPIFTRANLRAYTIITTILFLTWWLMFLWSELATPFLTARGGHETFPGKNIATMITKDWREQYQTPLPFVAGPREMTLNISAYSSDHPEPFFDWNLFTSPWIHADEFKNKGTVLIWQLNANDSSELPPAIAEQFKQAKFTRIYESEWAVKYWLSDWLHFKKIPPAKVLVGFVPPNAAKL